MNKINITTWCVPPVDPPIHIWQGFNSKDTHRRFTFGERVEDYSYCLDFLVDEGSPVYAAFGGEVFGVQVDSALNQQEKGKPIDEQLLDRLRDSGNIIAILHDDGTFANYGHLQQGGSFVTVGQRVEPGQKIGLSGNTGLSSEPHLHFGIYEWANEQVITSIPFQLLDYDGPLDDREVRPAAYTAVVRTIQPDFPVDGRIRWVRLTDLG